jgi:hypothetical protein
MPSREAFVRRLPLPDEGIPFPLPQFKDGPSPRSNTGAPTRGRTRAQRRSPFSRTRERGRGKTAHPNAMHAR